MQKKCVGFVFGGASAEREISIVTMLQVKKFASITPSIIPYYFYIDEVSGNFYYLEDKDMISSTFVTNEKVKEKATKIEFCKNGFVVKRGKLFTKTICKIDAIVNCCHGGIGEGGELAGYFATLNIPFSTTSHTYLGFSMDKNLFKSCMRSWGVKVPDWICFSFYQFNENKDEIIEKVESLGYPLIVKPNASGSSLGITIVNSSSELEEAITVAFEFDDKVIAEKVVKNLVEFNCACLKIDDKIYVSEVDQIEKSDDKTIFSFEEKYIGEKDQNASKKPAKKAVGMDNAKRLLPAPISKDMAQKIQKTARLVYENLGASGVARIDFLFDKKKKSLYVGEINAVPGSFGLYFFSGTSIDGISLISAMVKTAIKEHEIRTRKLQIKQELIPKIFK